MELTYQSTMQMPASYCVLSQDEMTYLGGGYTFDFGKVVVEVNPEVLGDILVPFAINATYNIVQIMGAGIFSAIVTGVTVGIKDGLSPTQIFTHYWNRQTTFTKVLSVGGGILAAGYAAAQVYSIYKSIASIFTTDNTTAATTTTTAAAA